MRTKPIINYNLTGTSGNIYFSGYDQGQPNPVIISISQNAGTINGGSVINVIGNNFVTGMTSTLGTVSAITSTTCTITTNSGSAGLFPWTLHDPGGGFVTGPGFTYLSHPNAPTISPIFGPDNATQAATFVSTNLPFGYSGVPFTINVGGLNVTSLSATSANSATGIIPSGGMDGLVSVTVTVDGVSATTTNEYTFRGIPTISSVSQNAGTINGSSTVNVTGTQFFSGMTSNLGTVSAITPTSCTIITNSGSTGAFTWTLTNTTGASANQTFTYLAHPGTPSVSPNSGPDSATQFATFISSSFPFGFTGVSTTITVGGASVTGLTVTSNTTVTGTIPSGGTDGAQNVIVTVDGVSTTGTGAYTFFAAPTLTLATPNIGSSAGGWSVKLTGTNFTGATGVTINSVAATSVTVVNSTTITCVAPSFGNANGSSTGQTISVSTPGGVASSSATANKYFYLPSNKTIEQFCRGDVGTTIATGVSQWSDQSGQGNHWLQATTSAQPTLTANYNSTGLSYLSFNGTSDTMSLASFASAPTDCTIYMVATATILNSTRSFYKFLTNTGANFTSMITISSPAISANDGVHNIQFTSPDTNPHVYGLINLGITNSIASENGTNVTGNYISPQLFNGLGLLGSTSVSAGFFQGNILAILIYNGPISSGDQTTVNSILRTTSNI